ncbi:hypothetical protein CsSME_00026737 [Camellia sinensis var. sinensis]
MVDERRKKMMDHVLCRYIMEAQLKTSWTQSNPRQRFLGCPQYGSRHVCGFFLWVDPPLCPRAQEIIPGLLRRTTMLEEQLKMHRERQRKLITLMALPWLIFWCWNMIRDGSAATSLSSTKNDGN